MKEKKLRCLVVEDNPDSLALLDEILQDAGYLVDTAENGVVALKQVGLVKPDVIICDILLPLMDGFEFCYRIKSNSKFKTIPFIIYTATYTETDAFRLAESLRVDKFIIKPVEPEILLNVMDKLLAQPAIQKDTSNVGIDFAEFTKNHQLSVSLKLDKKLVELSHEQSAREALELRFNRLVKNLPDECFFYRINDKGEFTFVSHSIVNILGYQESQFLGHYQQYFCQCVENELAIECMEATLQGQQQKGFEAIMFDNQDNWHYLKFIQVPLEDGYDHGEIEGIAYDLTRLKKTQQELHHQVNYDPLTQLPNRVLAADRLTQSLANAERYNTFVGLVYLDLDNFKDINDTDGHKTGDRVLQAVSQRLQKCVREIDTVARLSGDEFLFILPFEETSNNLNTIANKINTTITQPLVLNGKTYFVTASMGITFYPMDGKTSDELMRNADLAMYQAKAAGRNTFHYFTDELNKQAQKRVKMDTCLHYALPQNEFSTYYQPLKELYSGRIVGVEALLRWNSSVLGQVPPADFIPLAEANGSIIPISAWVLEQVCLDFKKLRRLYTDLDYISINLSPCQFRQKNLAGIILAALERHGLPVEALVLEITENTLMENIPEIKNHFTALQQASFSLAIDDFGTGYSSLSYLKRFPFDKLKIDRSFIRDIGQDQEDEALVKAIILMARSLGIKVIAEGVENELQHAFLLENNCDIGQGYFYGYPKPIEI